MEDKAFKDDSLSKVDLQDSLKAKKNSLSRFLSEKGIHL